MENQVYYCNSCGDYVFLMNFYLDACPERPFDKAIVVDEEHKVVKMNTIDGEAIIIKRINGFEKREILNCSNCQIPVAYHQNTRYLYIIPDSVSLTKVKVED